MNPIRVVVLLDSLEYNPTLQYGNENSYHGIQ